MATATALRPATPHRPVGEPGARLSDQVARHLSDDIQCGRIGPGQKLPTEAALTSQFGVSRAVVREAVSRLKSLGVVASRQGSGAWVNTDGIAPLAFDTRLAVSRQAVVQMAEVRRALEAEVAALAAQRRTATDIAHIRAAIAALDRAVQQGGDGVEEDLAYHRAIGHAAGNPFLMSTLDYMRQFLRGAIRVTRANEARRADFTRQVRDEHRAIAQAVIDGDVRRARQAAARHMNNAIRRIEKADPDFWVNEGLQLATPLVQQARRR